MKHTSTAERALGLDLAPPSDAGAGTGFGGKYAWGTLPKDLTSTRRNGESEQAKEATACRNGGTWQEDITRDRQIREESQQQIQAKGGDGGGDGKKGMPVLAKGIQKQQQRQEEREEAEGKDDDEVMGVTHKVERA